MTVRQALKNAESRLLSEGVDDPRMEAQVLLAHLLSVSRARLYADLLDPIPADAQDEYDRMVERRAVGEPTAYLTGRREFYGLDLHVDPRVLIPRPETELLVELALDRASVLERPLIAEVGVGSAAVAVSLARHLPTATIYATDLSTEALEVAAINCRAYGVEDRVRLLHGDLLGPVPEQVDVILSNPPYVNRRDLSSLPIEIREHEPRVALDGGADGLDVIRRLLPQVRDRLKPSGAFLMEIGYDQAHGVRDLACSAFPGSEVELVKDLAGIERVLVVR